MSSLDVTGTNKVGKVVGNVPEKKGEKEEEGREGGREREGKKGGKEGKEKRRCHEHK